MSNIRFSIEQLNEPSKSISTVLINFYEQMKSLENDVDKDGLQATLIIMCANDIESIIVSQNGIEELFKIEPV
jgi:hypothetical protein